MFYPIKWTEN